MCWLMLILFSRFLFHSQMCISAFEQSTLINTRKPSTHSFVKPSNLHLISNVLCHMIFMFFFSPNPKRDKKCVGHKDLQNDFPHSTSDCLRIPGYPGGKLKWICLSCWYKCYPIAPSSKFLVQLTKWQYLSRALPFQNQWRTSRENSCNLSQYFFFWRWWSHL